MSARPGKKVQRRRLFSNFYGTGYSLGSTQNPSSIAPSKTGIHPHFNERCISDELVLSLCGRQALYRAPHPNPKNDKIRRTI
jgi:hypothetical protein